MLDFTPGSKLFLSKNVYCYFEPFRSISIMLLKKLAFFFGSNCRAAVSFLSVNTFTKNVVLSSEISHIEEPLSNSSDDLVARGRKFYVSSYATTVKGLCNNKM